MSKLAIHALVALFLTVAGCALPRRPNAVLIEAAERDDALVTADALETLVAAGQDTLADREYAYEQIREHEQDTAAYAFARASVAGRVIEGKGLLAAALLPEAESYARRSRELDPEFRGGVATRMLGTLYVIAPASLLKHGDSEVGLELLEGLTDDHPDVPENHLRLAEAYIMLHDPDPARPHLCMTVGERNRLRRDDQQLLDRLLKDVGALDCK